MNIQELAEKAGMTRCPSDWQCRAPYWDVVIDSELEHFAALVLEEAAKVCDEAAERSASARKASKTVKATGIYASAESRAIWLADAIRALKGAKE